MKDGVVNEAEEKVVCCKVCNLVFIDNGVSKRLSECLSVLGEP